MGFRGGGVKLTPPPSISWFSSTPAGIGLNLNFNPGVKYLTWLLEYATINKQKS